MVQIHVNQTPDHQFLYNCSCSSGIDEIGREIVRIYNLQAKIHHLVPKIDGLLQSKPEESDQDSELALKRVLSEAKTYVSKDQVMYKKPLSLHILRKHVESIEAAVVTLSDSDLLQQFFSDLELLNESKAQLWWAGKELSREKKLSAYIGSNEKTKIIVRMSPFALGCNSAI